MFATVEVSPTREDLVYRQLRRAIIDHTLRPGQEVVVAAVALQMGVSRIPVIQACKRLVGEGFLIPHPRRSVTVAPLTAERIEEGKEVLLALECLALEHLVKRVTERHLAHWERLNEASRTFTCPPGSLTPNVADQRFHAALWEAAGRPYLLEQIRLVYDRNEPARALGHRRPDPERSAAEHAEVLAALRRRDAPAAQKALRWHRERATGVQIDVLKSWEAPGEPGEPGEPAPAGR